MQIEITKEIQQIEVIEVELPYYYKHDLISDHNDSVIYGKIEENTCTSIQETKNYDGDEKYEIEKEEYYSIKNSGFSCYFDEKFKSTKEEFELVKKRCTAFLSNC